MAMRSHPSGIFLLPWPPVRSPETAHRFVALKRLVSMLPQCGAQAVGRFYRFVALKMLVSMLPWPPVQSPGGGSFLPLRGPEDVAPKM
jgi:hypothetical protein